MTAPVGSGSVVRVTRAASPQFVNPFLFRVIKPPAVSIYYDGWVWLDGYELDMAGDAIERRHIFVQADGLEDVSR